MSPFTPTTYTIPVPVGARGSKDQLETAYRDGLEAAAKAVEKLSPADWLAPAEMTMVGAVRAEFATDAAKTIRALTPPVLTERPPGTGNYNDEQLDYYAEQAAKRAPVLTEQPIDQAEPTVRDRVVKLLNDMAEAGNLNVWQRQDDDGLDIEEYADIVMSVNAALAHPAPDSREVEVKPLEWSVSDNSTEPLMRAVSVLGYYRVWTHREANSKWFWQLDKQGSNKVDNVEAAKAAAQADYEARILSALTPPLTAATPRWDGWRSIESAPEDEHVILCTSGGHVGEALMLRDEGTGEQKWTWAGGPVSKFHTPFGWQLLPTAIDKPVRDLGAAGLDGPTGAE